ncbi:MFS transporter [Peribacillus saganii]|uniref:MFS transporter n=1 Tax=Peribacillus saganii TaxID=2303992 RepID=A0A372LCE5_9BACI|nr:MFS transporter [Peribacillus saganii]RFU63552.1 MFS transporter [Peribacillus saganii]
MSYTKNEKLSFYNGIASTASTNMVNGYIPLFAISVLGATNTQMGLITSLPSIIGMLAVIPGAILLNRVQSKKNFAALSTLATRFLFMLILFIPFLSQTHAAWILVILIALLNFPGSLSNLSWQSMIGDLIPSERRGNFFSSRNRYNTIAALAVTFLSGFFLNLFDKNDAYPYQILIILGFIFAIFEVWYLFKHKEDSTKKENNEQASEHSKKFSMEVFSYKPYVMFLICALLFNFAAQMGWSIFSIYHIKEANATAMWFSLFSVTNQLAQIISIKWWANAADRWGNTMVLFVAAAGMATAPVLTILSANLIYLTLINLWIGLFVSGTNLLLFNQLLKATPDADRTNYIANYTFLLAIVGFIAPQTGVYLLNLLGMNHAMTIVSAARFIAAFSFLFVAIKINKRQSVEAIQLP